MPELPEVEMFRRYAEDHFVHRSVEDVEIRSPEILLGVTEEGLRKALVGGRLLSARRHGKYLFLELDLDRHLIIHFGMTGSIRCHASAGADHPHVRALLHFDDDRSMAFRCQRKLGRIGLTDTVERFVLRKRLGPDALAVEPEVWAGRIRGRRGRIKGLLLDQSLVAGVGNEYSDEILHQCAFRPERRADDLDAGQIALLHRKMREVLLQVIDLDADWSRLPDHYLIPKRGHDGSCPGCGGALSRVKVSGRSSYYCPRCQF